MNIFNPLRSATEEHLHFKVDLFEEPASLAFEDTTHTQGFDAIERVWGPRIAARGIYRDPVRSSHGHSSKQRPALVEPHDPLSGFVGKMRQSSIDPDTFCRFERYDKSRQDVLQLCR